MNDIPGQAARSIDHAGKIARVYAKRVQLASEHFAARVEKIFKEKGAAPAALPATPLDAWNDWQAYAADFAQRSILFWDTLRQRGNGFLEHERAGKPPVLHFAYEMELDGRSLARPVNYALVRIVPPAGVKVDPKRRPYVIIDPRAGHGPGIGGMKDDSQVGVALRDGHPVYFVIFFPDPVPGQTMLDVCEAERQFIAHVRKLHPKSAKPVVVGNCQGGWAAMMLAAANPDDVGPIVINGAPMSYWGGAWSEGEGDNPMRYAGGNLGGTWLASLTADLGDGIFDGAWLVENFEGLNPANTWWNKYYNLFSKVDTEAPRFLDFERWWGGFYLMNREEIEWITQNLFVGNRLWKGGVKSASGKFLDLKGLRTPIILFASLGDNITPPQQAFNWVADVYGSTEEIKANGQVIVGLMHENIGHLGIFVSGKVAKKEYTQIVSVLKSVEALAPGLYAMKILEEKGRDGKVSYHVQFEERRLEDVVARLNRFERSDEKPFEAAAAISEFNQKAYELFARPVVQSLANPQTAQLGRQFHKLRVERWALSDLNPFLWWLKPAAEAVKAARAEAPRDLPLRKGEQLASEMISASLDLYRDLRDAQSEAQFFSTYGNLMPLAQGAQASGPQAPANPRDLSFVKEALASVGEGGYAEAVARCACLLKRKDRPLPLELLHLKAELAADYGDLLPKLRPDEMRRIRGEQEIIVDYEPEGALATLPALLADAADRRRLLQLLERLLADKRIEGMKPSAEQVAMLARIRGLLGVRPRLVVSTAPHKPQAAKPAKARAVPKAPKTRKAVKARAGRRTARG
jgi:pimeloyl-ACP methyl ester carboxylesterase